MSEPTQNMIIDRLIIDINTLGNAAGGTRIAAFIANVLNKVEIVRGMMKDQSEQIETLNKALENTNQDVLVNAEVIKLQKQIQELEKSLAKVNKERAQEATALEIRIKKYNVQANRRDKEIAELQKQLNNSNGVNEND